MGEQNIKKQSIIKNKKTILLVLLIFGIIIFTPYLLPGYYYFGKYCEKEDKTSKVYYCNKKASRNLEMNPKIFKQIKTFCIFMGFDVNDFSTSSGAFSNDVYGQKINGLTCFSIKDGGKKCIAGEDCSSGYCIADSNSCEENCTGSCWENPWIPDCTRNMPRLYILKDGKAAPSLCPWS